jgi:hypothetical protein
MEEVLIISDSILKYCGPPKNGRIIALRGAKIKDVTRLVKYGHIAIVGVKLCILHLGTNDIDSADYDLTYPRFYELIYTS